MSATLQESKRIERAVGGDRVALQQLLVSFGSRLLLFAEKRLPHSARNVFDPEDIVQQTFAEAFRSISRFHADEGMFISWLTGIAENKILDAVKGLRREKRGGNWQRVHQICPTESCSAVDLLTMLSSGHTPSISAMGHEAVCAVHEAIDILPEDHRMAVRLRFLQGMSLDEVAEAMNRSPRAVQGLIDRGKKKMRATLTRLSKYQ